MSIHCMIEKIRDNPRINKLCIIQLIEAKFNAILKVKISKQLMSLAERHQSLGTQMNGGRRNRVTIGALLSQCLAYNISRQKNSLS